MKPFMVLAHRPSGWREYLIVILSTRCFVTFQQVPVMATPNL